MLSVISGVQMTRRLRLAVQAIPHPRSDRSQDEPRLPKPFSQRTPGWLLYDTFSATFLLVSGHVQPLGSNGVESRRWRG